MLGWKIQSQLEAAHRAGGSLTGVVMSYSSRSKMITFLNWLRSFPLQSLEKNDPAVIMQEELYTGVV